MTRVLLLGGSGQVGRAVLRCAGPAQTVLAPRLGVAASTLELLHA